MPKGRRAFTLVELMVVIGLMALLGTVSVTGYFAAVQGMKERAVFQDTLSLIRQAMQICLIDQTPTAVLFYNRQTIADTTATPEELRASSAGSAVAIKMVGRISYIDGDVLVDEFADWNQSRPVTTSSSRSNDADMPFYRMPDLSGNNSSIEKCLVYVSSAVEAVNKFDSEYMLAYGGQVQNFCQDYKKRPQDNRKFSDTSYPNGNNQRWGHRITQKNGITWKVGDPYGVEIGSLNLPKGYIYGKQQASSTKISGAGVLLFRPSDLSDPSRYDIKLNQPVSISVVIGKDAEPIHTITDSDLKDNAK